MECNQDRIHDYTFDLLPVDEVGAVIRHIASCRPCATLAEGYRREAGFWETALAVDPFDTNSQAKPLGRDRRAIALALGAAACFLAAVVAWLAGAFEGHPDGSTKVVYGLDLTDVPLEAQQSLATEAKRVVERRLAEAGLGAAKVHLNGRDRLVIAVPPNLRTLLEDASALIVRRGRLELFSVASLEDQEKFNRDPEKKPPSGFKVLENPLASHGQGFEAYGAQIIVKDKPIIGGKNITASEARQSLDTVGNSQWVTTFELDADGAKAFDEAAKVLFSYKPNPGMIAIVLDGKLRSFPMVRSASFGGHGQISGAKTEQDAKDLMIVLRSGELPVPLRKAQSPK